MQSELFEDKAFETNRDAHHVSKLCDLAREAICCHIESNSERIGELNPDSSRKVVEIDESLFFKPNHNRGRMVDQQWYIGGIECGTMKCFIVTVPNRNAKTMTRIIIENIIPSTKIITDKWRAYAKALSLMPKMEHISVNHSLNFVDPEDSTIHTQNIEGLWSRSKYYLRKRKEVSTEKQLEYLIQFLWEYSI